MHFYRRKYFLLLFPRNLRRSLKKVLEMCKGSIIFTSAWQCRLATDVTKAYCTALTIYFQLHLGSKNLSVDNCRSLPFDPRKGAFLYKTLTANLHADTRKWKYCLESNAYRLLLENVVLHIRSFELFAVYTFAYHIFVRQRLILSSSLFLSRAFSFVTVACSYLL